MSHSSYRCTRVPTPKEDESMVEWFKRATTKNTTLDDIMGLISCLNARTMIYDTLSPAKQEKMKEDIIEFTDYILDKYDDNDVFYEKLHEEWPDSPPRIFAMSSTFQCQEVIEQSDEIYSEFDEMTKKNLELLMNYIWSIRQDRCITTMTELGANSYDIPKSIPRNELETEKAMFRAFLINFMDLGGSMVVRYINPSNKRRFILNGFFVYDGYVNQFSTAQLKESFKIKRPDGCTVTQDDEDYQVAPLIFAKG